jgi:hypothetical protein
MAFSFISLRGVRDGGSWKTPPLLQAISPAKPGIYTLKGTGENVENPDLLATWRVQEPQRFVAVMAFAMGLILGLLVPRACRKGSFRNAVHKAADRAATVPALPRSAAPR